MRKREKEEIAGRKTSKSKHFQEGVCEDWRSWGSWFSWGSPIGLSLGFAIFITSLGLFFLLLHFSGLLGK